MGFRIVDRLAVRHRLPKWRRLGGRYETAGAIRGRPVLLVKPLTYMNRSGQALAALAREEPFEPAELLVCYDDFALPLGRIRIRPGGSHGGHNGMRSIVDRLGTSEIARLRVGVGASGPDASEHVLTPFRRSERPVIDEAEERAADAVECALADDLIAAMNRYNPDPEPSS